jgi:hypothetical protein
MELLRDGKRVEPIHPGRIKLVVNVDAGAVMKDVGYFGYYEYPPEAFQPGATLTLRVWEQGIPDPTALILTADIVHRIWTDFEPYRKREAE